MARRKKLPRSAEFKAKVALAALADGKTVQQISTLYDVRSSQVQTWKKQLQVGAAEVFQAGAVGADKLAQRRAIDSEGRGRLRDGHPVSHGFDSPKSHVQRRISATIHGQYLVLR